MYDIENYYNAETIKEAVTLLKEHPDARVISGGSDVLIKIREGKMAGTSLVSIRDIKEIKGIRQMESGDIYIGAGTTFSHVTNDPVIQKLIPVLGEAVDQVGGPQVRNIGTIGGNVCNGAVSADSAPTLFSLNAMLRIADGTGGRMVPIKDFYLGPGRVDLHQGDVLTHIVIPGKDYQMKVKKITEYEEGKYRLTVEAYLTNAGSSVKGVSQKYKVYLEKDDSSEFGFVVSKIKL